MVLSTLSRHKSKKLKRDSAPYFLVFLVVAIFNMCLLSRNFKLDYVKMCLCAIN